MDKIEQKPKQQKPKGKKTGFLRAIKYLFVSGLVLGIFALVFVTVFIIKATRDLPSLEVLRDYSPAVMSRVHAGDGKLIAEYGIEKRVFVPISSIPKGIQHALVASEDQRFYQHKGFDPKGFTRAMLANIKHKLKGERLEGGSTLTQQVAKHFVVGDVRSVERKIRDIFIAKRIEKVFSKDQILELYLNDVYFGKRSYGIAAASLNYFNKPLDNLTLGEMAYLAGLVKGPNNYQIEKNYERAIARRNYVLTRMVEDGYISEQEAEKAKQEKLELKERLLGDEYLAAEYFVAEVRKQISKMYGEDELNNGGLSIRTTLDTKMQLAARKALRRGLEMYDRRHGWRGALARLPEGEKWQEYLVTYEAPPDIGAWKLAVVLDVTDKKAELGFAIKGEDDKIETKKGYINLADIGWAGKALANGKVGKPPKSVKEVVKKGDIILVEAKPNPKGIKALKDTYNLRQIPEANGGIIAMDPHTGRVLALVGGYSFKQSQFNRATQAYRQPGSSFKPFVYAAALDNGFTPVSKILDAPFVIARADRDEMCAQELNAPRRGLQIGVNRQIIPSNSEQPELRGAKSSENTQQDKECGPVFYKPANFSAGKWYGLSTLRLGLEKSRNAMTVRLANDIGMKIITDYGKKFGIYDETKPELAWALGAGETTLLRMAAAYASIDNGGKKVTPTLLDRVQNNKGETVFRADNRVCPECKVDEWVEGLRPPVLPDEREQVLDPITAYQITSMLEGVVQRGTGRQMLRLGRPIAGKTGTTNDYKDAWFMGFSPDLVAGVYVGYDNPKSLGTETGAKAAGPIFRFFMGDVLKDKPKVSFRIPDGVSLAPVDATTGEASFIGAANFIYEAFRPGTEPHLGDTNIKNNVGYGDYEDYDFGFSIDEGGDDGSDEEIGNNDDAKNKSELDVKSPNGNETKPKDVNKYESQSEPPVSENAPEKQEKQEKQEAPKITAKDEASNDNNPAEVKTEQGEGEKPTTEANPEALTELPAENTKPEDKPEPQNDDENSEDKPEPQDKDEVDLDDGLY